MCINGQGHMTKMVAMPIYGKKLEEKLLLQNQKSYDLETSHAILGAQALQSLYKNNPRLTLTYFTARSNLVTWASLWEKVKTANFQKLLKLVTLKLVKTDN